MNNHILSKKEGKTLILTINRPERMNAMHPDAWFQLRDEIIKAREDKDVWCIVLTGSGDRAFCAGADLKWKAANPNVTFDVRPVDTFINEVEKCFKPIVAAINGFALGGGLELALCADILIASDQAKIGLPEVTRGLIADAGGIVKLAKRINYHKAVELVLTGRTLNAQEAADIGLVNEVVSHSELMNRTMELCKQICQNGPLAVRAAKEIIKKLAPLAEDPTTESINALPGVQYLRNSKDYREGPKAFAEKRKPEWKGE